MSNTQVPAAVVTFMGKVMDQIINPVLALVFALALFYFIFGLFIFIARAGNPTERQTGRRHMMWGLIGMLIMVSVFALLKLALHTFNIQQNDLPAPTGAWFGSP